jgi:hypothetical protein
LLFGAFNYLAPFDEIIHVASINYQLSAYLQMRDVAAPYCRAPVPDSEPVDTDQIPQAKESSMRADAPSFGLLFEWSFWLLGGIHLYSINSIQGFSVISK